MFSQRVGLAVAMLCLGAPAAHAQAAPVNYWIPGWPMGFNGAAADEGANAYGNLVDQIPGWRTAGTAKRRVVITPTGHRYDTRPPPALGPRLPRTDKPAEQLQRAG